MDPELQQLLPFMAIEDAVRFSTLSPEHQQVVLDQARANRHVNSLPPPI